MAHRIIIMHDKGEGPGSVGSAPPPARDREVLEATAAQVASVSGRLFRLIKARAVRNIELPENLRELGESQMWVLHALGKGKHLTSQLARHYNVTNPTMTRIVDS